MSGTWSSGIKAYWPGPFIAGLVWGLFMACRVSVPVVGYDAAGIGVLWVWPAASRIILAGLGGFILHLFLYLAFCVWLGSKKEAFRAGRGWWVSLALLPVLLVEYFPPLYSLGPAPAAVFNTFWPLALAVTALANLGVCLAGYEAPPVEDQHRPPEIWPKIAVALLTLCLAGGVSWSLARTAAKHGPFHGGDEPSYLLMTHSLAVDHDLDLANNLRLLDTRHFVGPRTLLTRHHRYTPDGGLFDKFRPGLPLMAAPFYAWGMYLGKNVHRFSALLVWLLFTWTALEIYLFSLRFFKDRNAGLMASGAFIFCMPGLLYSNLLFPEMAAAALSFAAFSRLSRVRDIDWPGLLTAGICTAYLGWLHERFLPLALILALYGVYKGVRLKRRDILAFWLPLTLSAILLGYYFYLLYGVPWPSASLHAQGSYLNPRGAAEGLLGSLFDAAEGLIINAPVWLAGIAGLIWLLRKKSALGLAALAMAGSTYLVAGLYADWFGGINPPARYLVSALPFLACGLAGGWALGARRFKLSTVGLLLPSLAVSVYAFMYPSSLFGHRVVLDSFFQFALITGLLPSFLLKLNQPGVNFQLALIWALGAGVLVAFMQGGKKQAPALWAAVCLCLGFAAVTGLAAWADHTGPKVASLSGPDQRRVLWNRLAGLKTPGFSWQAGQNKQAAAKALTVDLPPAKYRHEPGKAGPEGQVYVTAGSNPGLVVWGQYIDLPPGEYLIEVDLGTPAPDGPAAWLDVAAGLGRMILLPRKDIPAGHKGPMIFEFKVTRYAPKAEIRVGVTGLGPLVLKKMRLVRLIPE